MRTMGDLRQGSATQTLTTSHGRKPAARTLGRLTARQLEIVLLGHEGKRPTEIAHDLCLSIGTVRRTINDACQALGVHGMPELVAEARRRGLISTT